MPKTREALLDFLDSVPEALLVLGMEGEILGVNEQAIGLFGYTRDAVIGQPLGLLIHPNRRSWPRCFF